VVEFNYLAADRCEPSTRDEVTLIVRKRISTRRAEQEQRNSIERVPIPRESNLGALVVRQWATKARFMANVLHRCADDFPIPWGIA